MDILNNVSSHLTDETYYCAFFIMVILSVKDSYDAINYILGVTLLHWGICI